MALQDMAEEIVSEIITLVASDIISLKSFTLVNQRFGLSARRKLFSHFWLHIRSTSESGRRGAVYQENVDGTRFDFVAFAHANPELVGLSRRVRLPGQNLGYRDLRLPAALNLLVGVQDVDICGAIQFGVDWKAVPESMRNTLLQVIFPRLRILRISTSIINLPLNFLNHAPLLSHLDLQKSVDLASNADVGTPFAPGIEPALRQLRLGIWYSPRTSTAQNALFTAIQARIGELIGLTLDYPSRTIHKRFPHQLGRCVKQLTITARLDALLPFSCLPHLETIAIIIRKQKYQVSDLNGIDSSNMNPVLWLSHSLLGEKNLVLANIIFAFTSFPFHFEATQLTKAAFAQCENVLEEACIKLKSIRATFDLDGTDTKDDRQFQLDEAKQELGELFPMSFEKGRLFVEDANPDASPWISRL